MNILVTGAAGFIGSHLCERLLRDKKHLVIGIDGLIHDKAIKQRNLAALLNARNPRFRFLRANLLDADLHRLLRHVDVIYHLAGMPGVRSSWGEDFRQYVSNNILATQRLLEACKNQPLKKFIYVSTSSVYGEKSGKVSEDASPHPLSPYGVSKLSCEYLCHVYQKNEGIPIVILRYFTVYGPRQRPDMAFHRFIRCILEGRPVPVYGDGRQSRDFTFIDDCVAGTASVLEATDVIGETINIGGKERASVLDIIELLRHLFHKEVEIRFVGDPKGEPRQTWADITQAGKLLNYHPLTDLRSGLAREINDLKTVYKEREE
ncbi:NAD-dependent epimerase/dehydratase family protein [Sporolactobacillus sp. CPB3-1]|uniref:NAD-dependent epimerase/dehydratase family protein n=1 Tax=Sporolactobacillus mangiferae TaxID=2940498 RepID=A0ABT0M8V3_9BACL|nr:NAD-dependent epimerase/dehydratase family protein [Sporolactobacillus mangiferae]MCL1631311.1 NAD-dependent epimerase/dehydratase family protein [Sporolactobacillus mangiferae]